MKSYQKNYFKHLNSDIRTVKIVAYIATALFNKGYADIYKSWMFSR